MTRLRYLKKLLNERDLVRVLEAHNGLTGLIVENTKFGSKEFDAIWISSLTDSTAKGKPDTELVNFDSRFNTIELFIETQDVPIPTTSSDNVFKYDINVYTVNYNILRITSGTGNLEFSN